MYCLEETKTEKKNVRTMSPVNVHLQAMTMCHSVYFCLSGKEPKGVIRVMLLDVKLLAK